MCKPMEPGDNDVHEKWWMKWLSHCLSYLRGHGSPVKLLLIQKGVKNPSTVKKKDLENYRAVSFTLALCKSMEEIPLATQLRHMENNMVTDNRQHDFTKGKSCLTQQCLQGW